MDKPINSYSKTELKDMWLHAEIDRCPHCKKFHKKNGMTKFMQNITKCDDCKHIENMKKEADQIIEQYYVASR